VNAYFDAVTNLFLENSYPSDAIFNVDETGFTLSTTLPSKVLIRRGDTRAFKKISGRQEWITAIECIRASGVALPLLLIFKAKRIQPGYRLLRLKTGGSRHLIAGGCPIVTLTSG
jgi:hypothetical protein